MRSSSTTVEGLLNDNVAILFTTTILSSSKALPAIYKSKRVALDSGQPGKKKLGAYHALHKVNAHDWPQVESLQATTKKVQLAIKTMTSH